MITVDFAEKTPAATRAAQFFEELLPVAVEMRAEVFDRVHGSLALFVEGSGSWTICFGDHAAPGAIVEGASFEADCVAVFSTPMFTALLDGKVEGTPVVIGDDSLIEKLGQLLQEPARGGLGARLMNTTTSPKR